MKINILGTEYTIVHSSRQRLSEIVTKETDILILVSRK